MTSLAVLPPLKKTITDLMDEDLYQAPSPSAAFATDLLQSAPDQNTAASATLSSLLNIPDSFIEHYNRVNGSNNAVNNVASVFPENSSDYSSFEVDAPSKANPFTAYAAPDTLSGNNQSYQLPQHQLYSAYVKPDLVQQRPLGTRRGRITTLEQPDAGKQSKDEDYYLFNTDIQPSQMLNNRNFFNTEDYLDSSLFIMNGDLDTPAKLGNTPSIPVPGFEGDYLAMDEFAEDAEDLSEDSDDDNYFQDDNDDFDNYIMNSTDLATRFPSTDSYMRVLPPSQDEFAIPAGQDGYMDEVRSVVSNDSMDMQQDLPQPADETMLIEQDSEPRSSNMHIPEDYHQTGAEISAMNPNHQCDLVNPSTGHPCNKQFSRSYDLIRHQETIHASKKKIFRCVICEGRLNGGPGNGKLKTFSRGDALSRHIKVKHGLGGQEAVELINDAKENVEFLMV